MRLKCWLMIVLCLLVAGSKYARAQKQVPAPQKVILDTDIGDDIDDAYALALVLTSPELKLLGVTTAWGNTALRAQLVEGLLCETDSKRFPCSLEFRPRRTMCLRRHRGPVVFRCDRRRHGRNCVDGEDDSRQSRADYAD